ncbi:zinc finger protein 687b-like isoform X2 [Engraulis encrasicolus]
MGDMKTPDFDDLLAAFDIPDIDAKEAIQSAPEDAEGHHGNSGGGSGGVGKAGGGGAPHRPPSSPEPQHHQTPHGTSLSSQQGGEPPSVSVIVKNKVRPNALDTEEVDGGRDGSSSEVGSQEGGGSSSTLPTPRHPLRMQAGLGCAPEPLVHNGFEGCVAAEGSNLSLSPSSQAQGHSNGQLWSSPASPKAASEGTPSASSTAGGGGGGFGRSKPGLGSIADSLAKGRKPGASQPQKEADQQGDTRGGGGVPDRSSAAAAAGGGGGGGGSVSGPSSSEGLSSSSSSSSFSSLTSTASAGSVSTFFSTPATLPLHSKPASPPPPSSSSPPPHPPPPPLSSSSSTPLVGPLLPSSTLAESNSLSSPPVSPSRVQPGAGAGSLSRQQQKQQAIMSHDDEEESESESEPDLSSPPLVIQESPDSLMCSPPNFPCRKRTTSSSSGLFTSPSPTSASASVTSTPVTPVAAATLPPVAADNSISTSPTRAPSLSSSWLQTPKAATTAPSTAGVVEDKHPEHVIEERDSPESPEPEPPASSLGKRPAEATMPTLTPRGSSSGPADTTSVSQPDPAVGDEDGETRGVEEEEEEEEEEEDTDMETEEGVKLEEEEEGEEEEEECEQMMEVDEQASVTTSNDEGSMSPSMIKVRIKTVKTPTGSITRTVTRVPPNGTAAVTAAEDPRTTSLGAQKVIRPKRPGVPLPGHNQTQNQRSKGAVLPVTTLQDASTAMLLAASKAQNKMAAVTTAKLSPSAAGMTKATVLATVTSPSPSSSPMSSLSTSAARSVSQKAVNVNGSVLASSVASLATTTNTVATANKPASIVNSSGAVISRTQSSLVEAFNKILNSKNLLPSYKPDLASSSTSSSSSSSSCPPVPPPEWGLSMPNGGYRCQECGDSFALERSLARHLDRRSLHIEVTCNHCAKRLAFFNKCSLLLHAREHKERGLVMQCSHLVMRPISLEQMITGQQDTTPIGMLTTSVRSPTVAHGASSPAKEENPPTSTSTSTPTASPGPQALLPLPCKKAEPLQYNNNRCPECKSQFNGKAELMAHFQELKPVANTSCTQCTPPMLLPNPCSWSAHQRIHRHRAPHVCPECGGVARQPSFHTHLQDACLHYTRRIGYRCFSCQVVFGGLNSVKSHIQSAHCEVFHKCPSCPMAFKSAPSAQGHISSQHPTLHNAQAKMIYKCVMCETVFTQKALLYVHFDTHLTNQKVQVFKCPDCPKIYAQRSSMMEHMKTAHRKQEVGVASPASSSSAAKGRAGLRIESSDGEEWGRGDEEDAEEEQDGGRKSETGGGEQSSTPSWSCTHCHSHYTDKEEYISHMAKEHDTVLKKFPCSVCEGSFSSSSSLRRHIRLKHKDHAQRLLRGQLCVDSKRSFGSRLSLERHMQTQHGPGAQLPGRPVDRPKRGSEAADCSSQQDVTMSSVVGGGASVDQDSDWSRPAGGGGGRGGNAGTASLAVKQEAAAEAVVGLRCALCGFSAEEQAVFLEHIAGHRAEGADEALQCQQCGACFASATSLTRHQFISHRVRNTHTQRKHTRHAAREGAGDGTIAGGGGEQGVGLGGGAGLGSPGSPSQPGEDGERGTGALVCKVCGRRFDKASDLNTHFRTHGMAFITARKTDKP